MGIKIPYMYSSPNSLLNGRQLSAEMRTFKVRAHCKKGYLGGPFDGSCLRFGVRGVLETGSVLGGGILVGDFFPQVQFMRKSFF